MITDPEESKDNQEESGDTGEMSFLEHLEEFRWRIIKSAIGVIIGAVSESFRLCILLR
jgi:hypothetical protein